MRASRALTASFLFLHTVAFAGSYQHFSQGPISFAVPAAYMVRKQASDTECFEILKPQNSGRLPVATVCLYADLDPQDVRELGFSEQQNAPGAERVEAKTDIVYTVSGRHYPARKIRTAIGLGLVAKGVDCELIDPADDQGTNAVPGTCHVALIQTPDRHWAVTIDFLVSASERAVAPDDVFEKVINSLSLGRSVDRRRAGQGK